MFTSKEKAESPASGVPKHQRNQSWKHWYTVSDNASAAALSARAYWFKKACPTKCFGYAENAYLELAPTDEEDAMAHLLGSSITYRTAIGPQQGRKAFMICTLRPVEESAQALERDAKRACPANAVSALGTTTARSAERPDDPASKGLFAARHRRY